MQIYDSVLGTNRLPDDDARKITITGTLGDITELRVLVAGQQDGWPREPATELVDPGVRNLGTSTSSGIEIVDDDLRARTRLAVYTTDDIRGEIVVGQVQRIQAGFRPPGGIPNPGTIFANITATVADGRFSGNGSDLAIGYVRAGNAITGNLVAVGESGVFSPLTGDGYATINRVIVGPSTLAAGIQGDIMAERGHITSIYTTGPIGADAVGSTPARTPKIWAGDGIDEVLAIDEAGAVGTIGFRTVNFRADIQATRAAYEPLGLGELSPGGRVSRINTAGDIHGAIKAGSLSGTYFGPGSNGGPTGIFVRGVCYASITIEHVMEGQIIAKRFEAPIVIGRMMEGPIIAWEGLGGEPPATPTIPSVRIGLDEPPLEPGALGFDGSYGEGFVGIDNRSRFPGGTPCYGNYASSTPAPSAYIQALYDGTVLCEEGGFGELLGPSVIAAAAIGDIAISRMSIFEQEGSANFFAEDVVPLIESRRIGTLRIDEFREGVVWSGRLDDPNLANTNTADDYAQIGTVDIACMGNGAALWATDLPAGSPAVQIHVAGNMHGEIHLAALSPTASIIIDGNLAAGEPAENDLCGCANFGAPALFCETEPGDPTRLFFSPPATDPSVPPRNKGYRANALIEFADPRGLKGTVIINAANDGGTWANAAQIRVGSVNGIGGVSLAPIPAYSASSLAYGGGVVGVVPFRHYEDDAFPLRFRRELPAEDILPTVRSQDSTADGAVRLRFYGLLADASTTTVAAAVKVQRNDSGTFVADPSWLATLAPMPFATARNELRLQWVGGGGAPQAAPAGEYRVVHGEIPGDPPGALANLLCAGLAAGAPPASVPDFVWRFDVSAGVQGECYSTTLDYSPSLPDGVINPDDLGDFITDYFTVPAVAGPGGFAVYCPENPPPFDLGYKVGYTADGGGQCNEPFPDNLGDYITAYFTGC